MHFLCKFCRGIVEANDLQAGEEVQCGHCNEVVRVPSGKFAHGAIIGDFCIDREIAKGGMGVVYLSKQISLDRPAALKILQQHLVDDPTLVQGLIQEARAAAKLNHPNIVQAYAVGEDEGVFYFAMEFVDGPTMKGVLKEQSVIPPRRAAEIIRQIAEALACAWDEQKLTHRDLKPDNIIMSSNGRAKLADLGLSHVAGKDEEDASNEVLGTPQYISPEQLTGAPIDNRSDLYSLGATFFQFVTGRFPYIGKNADEIVRQHVDGTLTPPRQLNNQVPEALDRIIVKLMEKRPENRYQSAQELVRDIDAFLSGKTVAPQAPATQAAAPQTAAPAPVRIGTQSTLLKSQGAALNIMPAANAGAVKINFKKTDSKAAAPEAPATPPAPAETPAAPEAPAAAPQPEVKAIPTRSGAPLLKKPGVKPAPAPAAAAAAPAENKSADGAAAAKSMPGWNKGPAPKAAGMSDEQKQKIKLIVVVVLFALAGVFAFFNLGGMDMVNELIGSKPGTETAAPATPEAAATAATAPTTATTTATATAATTAETPVTPPPPPPLQTSNMQAMAEELIKSRPQLNSTEFLNRCDRFFMQFRHVDMSKESAILQRLAPLYAQAEEESRAPEARTRLAAIRSELIAGRREADARAKGSDAMTTEATRAVEAQNAELRQRLEARTVEFLAQMSEARTGLSRAFAASLVARNDQLWQTAWKQYMPIFETRWPDLTDDGKVKGDADLAYFKALQAEMPQALARIELFRQHLKEVMGAQWQPPEGDYLKMTGITGSTLQFTSLLNSSSKEFQLADIPEEARLRLAAAVDRRTGEPGSLFFAMLCQGEVNPAMAAIAPEGFWKNNFAELSRSLPARP